ncbi:MAG: flagellar biosynthetic protein FliR [Syntrophobacterales bacterium]|nr:MAG: flagellar biosynthetic protein FliR [Syntrophobacterales bacterium]
MNIPQITAEQVEAFILILLRVSAMIAMIPVLGNATTPVRVKGGLSLMIAFLLFPVVGMQVPPLDILPMVWRMAGEVMIGVLVGFMGKMILSALQLSGQLIGFQMGFAIVNVVDPITSTQVSITAQFQYIVAMLVFLAVDGHHVFLYAIAESYTIIPPLAFTFSSELARAFIEFSRGIFVVAVKIGAPVIAVLLMTSVGVGIVARTVPQINVFIVGFPLNIAMGLIGIGLTLPLFVKMVGNIFLDFEKELSMFLRLM